MTINWTKPLQFKYHSSRHQIHPTRLLVKDLASPLNEEPYVIAVKVGTTEHLYTVNECGCCAKGNVIFVYSYPNNRFSSNNIYTAVALNNQSADDFIRSHGEGGIKLYDTIEKEYEV